MTGEPPEALIHNLVGITGVAFEACQLCIAYRFEIQSNCPHNKAEQHDKARASIRIALA
jgi:hypothetical protein